MESLLEGTALAAAHPLCEKAVVGVIHTPSCVILLSEDASPLVPGLGRWCGGSAIAQPATAPDATASRNSAMRWHALNAAPARVDATAGRTRAAAADVRVDGGLPHAPGIASHNVLGELFTSGLRLLPDGVFELGLRLCGSAACRTQGTLNARPLAIPARRAFERDAVQRQVLRKAAADEPRERLVAQDAIQLIRFRFREPYRDPHVARVCGFRPSGRALSHGTLL